jgi:hypothetical protein
LQSVEDADLQDSRFLDDHRGSVALLAAQVYVLACREGDFRVLSIRESQAMNEIRDETGEMTSAFFEAQ